MDTSSEFKTNADSSASSADQLVNNHKQKFYSDAKEELENDFCGKSNEQLENGDMVLENDMKEAHLEGSHLIETPLIMKQIGDIRGYHSQAEGSSQAFSFDVNYGEGDVSPEFYGEGLNCLKLWRAVTRLGGYDQVASCKLWRQVGESFSPPKTCTTVSWSFRCSYEKALLEYEKHKVRTGELQVPLASIPEPISTDSQAASIQASASGRARRDAAARAM